MRALSNLLKHDKALEEGLATLRRAAVLIASQAAPNLVIEII